GVVFAIDATTLKVVWKFATRGGAGNCNNVAAPAIVEKYLHVGTAAGIYYVLDRQTGAVVREIDCHEPILSSPAVGADRVYFATLGAQVYAVKPDGAVAWTWDFVKEVVKFDGNRWSGEEWLAQRKDRVTWRDHFVCSRDICLVGKTVVIPAGGRTVRFE
ncbi:MAG: cell surface protein/lipoprotein, partial [Planctomycetota bacterium]